MQILTLTELDMLFDSCDFFQLDTMIDKWDSNPFNLDFLVAIYKTSYINL